MRRKQQSHSSATICGDAGTALWDEVNPSQLGLFQLDLWGTNKGEQRDTQILNAILYFGMQSIPASWDYSSWTFGGSIRGTAGYPNPERYFALSFAAGAGTALWDDVNSSQLGLF